MNCKRLSRDAKPANGWHRLWCSECCAAHASDEVIARGVAQMQAVKGYHKGLIMRTLLELGLSDTSSVFPTAWPHRKQRPAVTRRFALASLAMTLACCAVVVWPRLAAARTVRQIAAAVSALPAVHLKFFEIGDDGKPMLVRESWTKGHRFRAEEQGRISVFDGSRLWDYNSRTNVVHVRAAKSAFAFESSGLSIDTLLSDIKRWGWKRDVQVRRDVTLDGNPAIKVEITSPLRERMVVWADANTNLPLRWDFLAPVGENWKQKGYALPDYPSDIADERFAFAPPAGARVVDSDQLRDQVQARLDKGITSEAVSGVTITLRDVSVNADGDVFVLWTGGAVPSSGITITDDLGTTYLQSEGFQGHVDGSKEDGRLERQLKIQGLPPRGSWWTPVDKPGRVPQRITIVMPVYSDATDPSPETVRLGEVRFTVTDLSQVIALPDYMPLLLLKLDDSGLVRWRALNRGQYWLSRDPEKSISLFKVAIEKEGPRAWAQTWKLLGDAYKACGRLPAARRAYEQALKQPMSWSNEKGTIEKSLQLLQSMRTSQDIEQNSSLSM